MMNVLRITAPLAPFAVPIYQTVTSYRVMTKPHLGENMRKSQDASLLEKKIQPLLKKINMHPDLIIREHYNRCEAAGINIAGAPPPLILLPRELYSADKDALNFILMHEIAHLHNNDKLANKVILTSSGLSVAVLARRVMRRLPKRIFPISFIATILSHYIPNYVAEKHMLWREGCADDFASKHSTLKEKLGGRRHLLAMMQLNRRLRSAFPSLLDDTVSPEGENLSDTGHPTMASRVKKIEENIEATYSGLGSLKDELIKIEKLTTFLFVNNPDFSTNGVSISFEYENGNQTKRIGRRILADGRRCIQTTRITYKGNQEVSRSIEFEFIGESHITKEPLHRRL
jgi:hypothetical protein